MADVTIKFNTDNAAFEDDFESALEFVLRQIKKQVALQRRSNKEGPAAVYDVNGNRIGKISTDES